MHLVLPFFIFIHLHLASHLGTLDAPHEGRDVETNPKMVFGGPISKMQGPGVHTWSGGIIKTVQANLTDSCRISGKPRKHYKPPNF
jgi:hypothetical protein